MVQKEKRRKIKKKKAKKEECERLNARRDLSIFAFQFRTCTFLKPFSVKRL